MNPHLNSNTDAPVSNDPPIAAPSNFKSLDEQLIKMDNTLDELGEEAVSEASKSINAFTKETKKLMMHLIVPGVASISAASAGYVLLFSRTIYNAMAMLLGLGLGGQKIDPANLLEYWEREGKKSKMDDRERKVENMFG